MPVPRKILIRVIGAPLLVAALCGILYWGHTFDRRGEPNYPIYILVLLVGLVASYEMQGMAKAKGIDVQARLINVTLIAMFINWMRSESKGVDPRPEITFAAAVLVLFLVLAGDLVFRFGKVHPDGAAFTLFSFCYVALLGFLLFPPVLRELRVYYLLFLLAGGKGSDMAAFVVGKSIGKHKMTPVVSPNKTWEGGIAGGIAGAGAGYAVIHFTPLRAAYAGVPLYALLLFCLAVTIAAQVGDLVKSAFKRWAGVKDSGRVLPEFGGIIDMVDSFLIAAPVATMLTVFLRLAFKGS